VEDRRRERVLVEHPCRARTSNCLAVEHLRTAHRRGWAGRVSLCMDKRGLQTASTRVAYHAELEEAALAGPLHFTVGGVSRLLNQ
jgi:hypothetical protein